MEQNTNQPSRALRWTGTAIALLVIGLLILVPSGLCTAAFGVLAFVDLVTNPANSDFSMYMAEALIVGGPFILVGGALVFGATRLRKPK